MNIVIHGKTITISDKNARAYEKINGIPVNVDAIYVNIRAGFPDLKADDVVNANSSVELSDFINSCIEDEVRGCAGDEFYEMA